MRRNWFVAAIVIGIASIAVAALIMRLTADDSPDTPSPTAWADSVCTDLSTWKSSITSVADVGASVTPESLRQSLSDATTATQTLVDELEALGPPELESGDELKQQLDSAATEIQSSFDTLRQGAEDAADASSASDFIQALAALAPQFQALLDTTSTTLDDLANADVGGDAKSELQQAFADASSCQELRADS
jgi:hypothetical protein